MDSEIIICFFIAALSLGFFIFMANKRKAVLGLVIALPFGLSSFVYGFSKLTNYESEGLGTFFNGIIALIISLIFIIILSFGAIFKWHKDSQKKD